MNGIIESTQGFQAAPTTWHAQLENAPNPETILSVTRDYLATFGPEHLARLPADCRPGRIKGEDDIAYWSCKLAQHHERDPHAPVDAGLMQEMLNYFLHAWVRLSHLQRTTPSPAGIH
jgi:hypothetical protein